jgi:hypothetical protein
MSEMMIYPAFFRPSAPNDLMRIGARLDGGYVLPKRVLAHAKALLSFGLNDEFEFEQAVADACGCPVACFDPSVSGWFWPRQMLAALVKGIAGFSLVRLRRGLRYLDYRRFFNVPGHRHFPLALGYVRPGSVDLAGALDASGFVSDILLKMDIEGSEYRLFDAIVAERHRFVAIAAELHDVDLHEARISAFLAAMKDDFQLVHFHANSHTTVGPDQVSVAVEISLLRRDLLAGDEPLMMHDLPIAGLDAPNLPGEHDRPVHFAA